MIGIAILLACLLTTLGDEPAQSSKDLEARWRREYPRAADEWEATSREFLAKGSLSIRWLNGDTVKTKDLTVASSGDKKLFIRDRNTTDSPDEPDSPTESDVQCQTPEFVFKLTKMPPSDQYLIEKFQKYTDNPESEFNHDFKNLSRNGTVYYGTSLLQRMHHSSFLLKSIETIQKDGDELVRIVYSYEGKYVFESGAVDLDPGKNWAIRNVDITCTPKKKDVPSMLQVAVDYEKVDGMKFFPRRMESFDRGPNSKVFEQTIVQFDRIRLGAPSDDLFRLSAYGIPDLPLRPEARASVFTFRNPALWLALAATVACFASLWLLRSRKAWRS